METNNTQKEYIVIWHYSANYGVNKVKATSPAEAIKEHLFANRKDIDLFAFEYNADTMALRYNDKL